MHVDISSEVVVRQAGNAGTPASRLSVIRSGAGMASTEVTKSAILVNGVSVLNSTFPKLPLIDSETSTLKVWRQYGSHQQASLNIKSTAVYP